MPRKKGLERAIDRVPRNRKIAHARGLAAYAVDGQTPKAVVFPNTVEEVSHLLSAADGDGKAVVPWGGGTGMDLGNLAARVDLVIGTSRLNRVVEHEPADLTVIVEGGTTLGALQEELGRSGQFLPLDPPMSEDATIGGILATNASGPRRAQFGTARDRLIGIKVVHPNGDITKGGGKVVKNVSGYDMNKLYTGSLGTLGIIVEAAFKVAPRFKEERTLIVLCQSLDVAARLALDIPKTGVQPVALQLLDADALASVASEVVEIDGYRGYALVLELGGTSPSVSSQEREVRLLCDELSVEVSLLQEGEGPGKLWAGIRDMGRGGGRRATMIVKTTSLPTQVAGMIEGIHSLDGEYDMGCGVSSNITSGVTYSYWWKEDEAGEGLKGIVEGLRKLAADLQGHCVVEVCPTQLKSVIDVWGSSGPQALLMRRIKEQFDPRGTLNPGRFVDGI
ncbi:MAG: FAD-binding oxidoreductase [Chloroflexi bacterium]|nr:FAD-binding oxidoreductase [Chloroflexota bacterium]